MKECKEKDSVIATGKVGHKALAELVALKASLKLLDLKGIVLSDCEIEQQDQMDTKRDEFFNMLNVGVKACSVLLEHKEDEYDFTESWKQLRTFVGFLSSFHVESPLLSSHSTEALVEWR